MSAPSLLPLPCPFCGGEAEGSLEDDWAACKNEGCCFTGSSWAAWNRRAEPSAWMPIESYTADSTEWNLFYDEDRPGRGVFCGYRDSDLVVMREGSSCEHPTHFAVLPAAPKVS